MLRVTLFIVVILGVGALGAVAWIGLRTPTVPVATEEAKPPTAPVERLVVLAAARALRAGSLLKMDDITTVDITGKPMPDGARLDTAETRRELGGAMVRRALQPGDPLLTAEVLRPGEHGFLAAVLQPGSRATTVGVDAVTGTAGLIWPGDNIDLILTQVLDDPTLPAARRASAETMLTNVRVIAIDQQLMQGAVGTSTDQPMAHTVTLEVTPLQAERVAVAIRLGRLSLVVRSAEAGLVTTEIENTATPITWGGDVSTALNQGHSSGRTVKVFHGKDDGKEVKF